MISFPRACFVVSAWVFVACSSASSAPPSDSTKAPAPRSSGAAPPAVSVAASTAPAVPPAPVGESARLAFDLAVFGKDTVVPASLEVPSAYGIAIERGDAVLAGCRASSGVGSAEMQHFWMSIRGVALRARACDDGADAKACIQKVLDMGDAKPHVEWKGDTRALVDSVGKSKDGSARYEGKVVAYDERHKAAVVCSYTLSEEVAHYRTEYLRICESLALAPDAAIHKAQTRNATLSEAGREDLPNVKDTAKLRRAVEGWLTSMSKGDYAAARKFMLQADDCKKVLGNDAAKVKSCIAETATVAAMLKEGAGQFPKNIEVAAMRIAQGDGLIHKQPGTPGFYEVLVTPRGSECAVELSVFVMAVADDYRVFLPIKKETRRK